MACRITAVRVLNGGESVFGALLGVCAWLRLARNLVDEQDTAILAGYNIVASARVPLSGTLVDLYTARSRSFTQDTFLMLENKMSLPRIFKTPLGMKAYTRA